MVETGLEGLAQTLPLALTAAILLTLVALLLRSRRLARGRRREGARRDERVDATGAAIVPVKTQTPAAARPADHAPAPDPTSDRSAAAPASRPAMELVAGPDAPAVEPAAPPVRSAEDIRARIARAQTAGSTLEFAELHLELAERLVGDGELAAAAAELRKSILSGARLRQHGTHASARLLLGDLAEREGDLTTACEHWQIARSLFQDLAARDRLENAETRMRRIGCPTDWVLNDF